MGNQSKRPSYTVGLEVLRQEGHLAKILGAPLPDESPQELKRLAEDDRRRAQEGLVELGGPSGEISYKGVDDLVPEDRGARIEAELMRSECIREHRASRASLRRSLR
jgi:hypothetical protein